MRILVNKQLLKQLSESPSGNKNDQGSIGLSISLCYPVTLPQKNHEETVLFLLGFQNSEAMSKLACHQAQSQAGS